MKMQKELTEANVKFILSAWKDHSVTELAREFGVPKTTLSGWVAQIRQSFKAQGRKDLIAKLLPLKSRNRGNNKIVVDRVIKDLIKAL